MSHLPHLIQNKSLLVLRSHFIRAIREFFWSKNFLEVETPTILKYPGQEPYLSPMELTIHNEKKGKFPAFLHTSPEYTMKKMLAAGFEQIFSICKIFRDHESFGGLHNPEFTMIEWYRAHVDFHAIMNDCEDLLNFLKQTMSEVNTELKIKKIERISMRELWQHYIGVNLDDYLEKDAMFHLSQERGHTPSKDEGYEDVFYRIFLNEIEPKLTNRGALIIHHYPALMAALSKLSEIYPGYAERVEVYIHGIEIANGFSELTDPDEQLRRLEEEQKQRKKLGKKVCPIDMDFIEGVKHMPPSAGIALGIDRLFMALTGCKNIDDVIALPASQLF